MNESENDEFPPVAAAEMLASIDFEQDSLLLELDSLNARLEAVLRDCAPPETIPMREAA